MQLMNDKSYFNINYMKEQFQNNRQELISHIEAKLAQLKFQRDNLLNKTSQQTPIEKVKISNYLQENKRPNSAIQTKIIKPSLQSKAPMQQVESRTGMIESRISAKEKCQMLKDLYERKRELQSVGIYEKNPQKIKQIYQDPANVTKIKKNLTENKKKAEEKSAKNKIIQEQLTKIQLFLKQSKKSSKIKSTQSQYTYNQLLKGQQQKLYQYQQLLIKNKPTLVQKDTLLEMTFQLLKEFPERVYKKTLRQFLLVNQNFCKIFYLTKQEVMRDLQVHRTKEANYLNYQQYYEFIKSVQITNKAIKPNLNYEKKDTKTIKKNEKPLEKQTSENEKRIEQYLRKVFLYLDQKRQKIVQRQRIQIVLSKCLLFDDKKIKSTSKQNIIKFAQFIKGKRISKSQTNHFKKLDLKYIGLQQLLELYKKFLEQSSKKPQKWQDNDSEAPFDFQYQQIGANQQQQNEVNNQKQDQNDMEYKLEPLKETKLQQDFERFGWGDNHNSKESFSQLKQLDSHYKQMHNKYGNQIHWNNYKVYEEDFKKFNQCVAQMKDKHDSSKDIVSLNIQFPVYEQEAQNESEKDDFN